MIEEKSKTDRFLAELSVAREVQSELFPKSPFHLSSLQLHAVCTAARTISGDYYDFIPLSETELILAFGDVSGKGIGASLLMASLHSAVRAFSLQSRRDEGSVSPAHLLHLCNQHLYENFDPAKYATLFLCRYDTSTHLLTYANGGHLPPVVLSAEGVTRRLDVGGPAAGLLSGAHYEEETITLQTGDLVLIYSDGLTEPEKNGEEYGEERILAVIHAHALQPLPELMASVMQAVHSWIGNEEQPDDMTLLMMRLE